MTRARAILCQFDQKPCVTWLDADRNGDYATVMMFLVGVPIVRLPLHDGVELCCNRDPCCTASRSLAALWRNLPPRRRGSSARTCGRICSGG